MDLERSNWKAWLPVFGGLYLYTEEPPSWAREWMAHSFLNSNNSAPLKIRKIIYGPRCQDLESCHLGIHGRSKIGALPSSQRECIWSPCLCLMPSGSLLGPCPRGPAGSSTEGGSELLAEAQQRVLKAHCFRVERRKDAPSCRGGPVEEEETRASISRVMMRMIWIKATIHVVGVASFGNVRRSRASPQFPACTCVKVGSCEMAAKNKQEMWGREVREPEGWGK